MALTPEQRGTASSFYNSEEALRYSSCFQTGQLQRDLTKVALQLLNLPVSPDMSLQQVTAIPLARYHRSLRWLQAASCFLLDLGCGSGMSGTVLSEAGHTWVGCDISADMLSLAQGTAPLCSSSKQLSISPNGKLTAKPVSATPRLSSRTGYNLLNHTHTDSEGISQKPSASRGLVCQSDMAQGIPFRPDSLDGAISISAVQWLCHLPIPHVALGMLFRDLYRCLRPGCKAVLQTYLAGRPHASRLILQCDLRCNDAHQSLNVWSEAHLVSI